MSDDELEKLAAAMKNISPSKAARKSGMEAAMAAFDAEFETETAVVTETAEEKISATNQGLSEASRPIGQTTFAGNVGALGRDAMSKVREFFTFKPKTMMMMGTCAAALFATSLYIPNTRFEEMPKPAPEAVTAEVAESEAQADEKPQDVIVVTSSRAKKDASTTSVPIEVLDAENINSDTASSLGEVMSGLPAQEESSEVEIAKLGSSPAPVTMPKNTITDKNAPPTEPAPQSQGGINSISDLLNQVRTDPAKTEAENRGREAKFRQRRDQQAGLMSSAQSELRKIERAHGLEPSAAPVLNGDADQAGREYSAVLQRIDELRSSLPPRPVAPVPPTQLDANSTEKVVPVEGAIAEFEAPKIDQQSFKIQVSDRDVQPLVRIPPGMPPRAEKSGHCRLRFDVSPEGSPINVVATHCTESIFENASVKSVQKWKYNPKIVNGLPVTRRGVENKVSFRLKDEYGNIIPEAGARDQFEDFESNPVTLVTDSPVSTFSVDVDTASYSFMRSSINRGQLPSPGAVRLEEMINYFPYDYEAPRSADEPFKANVTVTPNPWNADTKLMHIGIKGYVPETEEKPKSNIVFLIDTSGSMRQPNKLPLLVSSFKLLLSTLDEDDTVSIVTYAGSAGTVLEPTAASEKGKIKAALDNLRAGGSTAGAAGLELAYLKAQESFTEDGNNRVILATDGDFNVGFSSLDEMKSFIEEKRETGIFLSVLGFGNGNYNDHLMQSLAQNGNGVAAYIDTLAEANKVLANEAGSALTTIAKDVKIQVEFNPAKIAEYRLIGYETRALKRQDFNNDKVDAGEINAGHTVTAIYEMTPVGSPAIVNDPLRYASDKIDDLVKGSDEYAFVKIRHKLPDANTSTLQTFPIGKGQERSLRRASDDMRFATAVAAFGQKLRGDTQLSEFSYEDAIKLATDAKGEDKHGYRAEFIQLMRLAENLE